MDRILGFVGKFLLTIIVIGLLGILGVLAYCATIEAITPPNFKSRMKLELVYNVDEEKTQIINNGIHTLTNLGYYVADIKVEHEYRTNNIIRLIGIMK